MALDMCHSHDFIRIKMFEASHKDDDFLRYFCILLPVECEQYLEFLAILDSYYLIETSHLTSISNQLTSS